MSGRMVRGGRVVARVLVVWVVSVLALRLLDVWLVGFSMPSLWQPTVIALAFGLLTAVVWPLVMRLALPVALFTLGIGWFLLLGAALLALSFVIPGVVVSGLGTAVIVVVAMSAVAALVSSLLGVDEDELFFRRAARRSPDGAPTSGPRACCSCRSTGSATKPCGARSATATCRRSRAGCARAATR